MKNAFQDKADRSEKKCLTLIASTHLTIHIIHEPKSQKWVPFSKFHVLCNCCIWSSASQKSTCCEIECVLANCTFKRWTAKEVCDIA